MRFVFSTRSKVPWIHKEDGTRYYDQDYKFTPGKDEIIRGDKDSVGWIVTFGELVYRSLDAVERLRHEGINVGLINKSSINMIDEDAMRMIGSSKAVLVVESWNQKTGLVSSLSQYQISY